MFSRIKQSIWIKSPGIWVLITPKQCKKTSTLLITFYRKRDYGKDYQKIELNEDNLRWEEQDS